MPFKLLSQLFSHKTKSENEKIQEWIQLQSYSEDAIQYLIEKEIYENGLRDLGYIIPRLRNDEYFDTLIQKKIDEPKGSGFEFTPHQKIFAKPIQESKIILVDPSIVRESEAFSSVFKSATNPVVVAPSNTTDLSMVDTACFDD